MLDVLQPGNEGGVLSDLLQLLTYNARSSQCAVKYQSHLSSGEEPVHLCKTEGGGIEDLNFILLLFS